MKIKNDINKGCIIAAKYPGHEHSLPEKHWNRRELTTGSIFCILHSLKILLFGLYPGVAAGYMM